MEKTKRTVGKRAKKSVGIKMIAKTKLEEKIREINGKAWMPVEIARLNGQVIRLALFKGEYHWHNHANEDELIFIYKGRIVIQFRDRPNVKLNAGEMVVIPKGTEHCPKSIEDSYVLMFEPANLKSEGG